MEQVSRVSETVNKMLAVDFGASAPKVPGLVKLIDEMRLRAVFEPELAGRCKVTGTTQTIGWKFPPRSRRDREHRSHRF